VSTEGQELLAYHMQQTNASITEIKNTLGEMSRAVSALVRVEQQQLDHAAEIRRAHAAIEDINERLLAVEIAIPLLRQTHSWVVAGVIGIVALVGISVYQSIADRRATMPVPAITSVQP